ncbi:MAG: hypothetical protein ACFFCI_09325 [Promethearchaeota archaeon]
MSEEIDCETIEITIPKKVIPFAEGIGTLAGMNIEALFTDIIRSEFQDLFEQPHHIMDYLDRIKCGLFREFEQGLAQWNELSKGENKDHKKEVKVAIPP